MNLTLEDVLAIPHSEQTNMEGLRRKMKVGISTDSRTTSRGDVFFALRGEKFDGHLFVSQAFERGAIAAVVDERALTSSNPMVIVPDTTKALGHLAHRHRKKFSIPFIAIAGSNGKTTTKDMIGDVLSTQFSVLKTEGNLNNHIGVPQTLFRLQKKHDVAVIEMGTNHPGEMSYLCGIVKPSHGLVTNIGHEHLEFFGDLHGVANEEGVLFDELRSRGTAFVNIDDPMIARKARKFPRKVSYGLRKQPVHVLGKFMGIDEKARCTFSVRVRGKKEFVIRLSVPGKHLGSNALAAVAVGSAFKVPLVRIQKSLERFTTSSKRMEVFTVGGVTILNDTYNANPDSMIAALETLQAMRTDGKRIAVLADMLELGARAELEHRSVGSVTNTCADCLVTYGPNARFMYEASRITLKFHYDQKNVLSEYVAELATPGDVILVKGSRGMRMEDVVIFLCERLSLNRSMISSSRTKKISQLAE
jgi:UDP-N-acetylmuramoyl-tripeptide--D-alanyl-D-alanine ligase